MERFLRQSESASVVTETVLTLGLVISRRFEALVADKLLDLDNIVEQPIAAELNLHRH